MKVMVAAFFLNLQPFLTVNWCTLTSKPVHFDCKVP